MRRFLLLLLGCVVLVCAACQGTNFDRTLTLTKDSPYLEVEFKGPRNEQKVTVSVSSKEAAVRAYLVLADHKDEAINALLKGKKPRKSIAVSESGQEMNVEGKIPAGKPFVVLIQPDKPLSDKIEIQVGVKGR